MPTAKFSSKYTPNEAPSQPSSIKGMPFVIRKKSQETFSNVGSVYFTVKLQKQQMSVSCQNNIPNLSTTVTSLLVI